MHFDAADASRFAAIYETSFPPWERGETAGAAREHRGRGAALLTVAQADAAVIGLAVSLVLAGTSIAFLKYLAVAPEQRNGGVGGKLLGLPSATTSAPTAEARSARSWKERSWKERSWSDGVRGRARPGRRKARSGRCASAASASILRHGATLVDGAPRTRTPNLERPTEGDDRAFTLLWLPLNPDAPRSLEGSRLRECVHAIFTQSYELDADDPLVQEVVGELVRARDRAERPVPRPG